VVNCHLHPLSRSFEKSGWGCDGRKQFGGCRRGTTGFGQTDNFDRYRCDRCDFEFCDRCREFLTSEDVPVCVALHPHTLYRNYVSNGWACDGRKAGDCKRGITGFGLSAGIVRYRCTLCDFDLCDLCKDHWASEVPGTIVTVHPHILHRNFRDNGWACDGRKLEGKCRSGITGMQQSKGLSRFRCNDCDFDLCGQCKNNWISKVIDVIDEAKTPFSTPVDIKTAPAYTSIHAHPLAPWKTNSTWTCNGTKAAGGCRSGFYFKASRAGRQRFRCDGCDYDLCDRCLKHWKH